MEEQTARFNPLGRSSQSVCLLVVFLSTLRPAQGQAPVNLNPSDFLSKDPTEMILQLERQRPPSVSGEFKARVLASLPAEGEIRDLTRQDRQKLAALEPILRIHDRYGVYQLMVIDVPQAFIGLHARSVVLISQTTFNLLDVNELQAQVAHELGHEYVWRQYEAARAQKDVSQLRDLELYCDGVAILTLGRLGIDPSRLYSGLDKAVRYNRNRFGFARNEEFYPSLDERRKFAQAATARVSRWASAQLNGFTN